MGVVGCLIFTGCGKSTSFSRNSHLALNDSNYFETRGLNFFVFSNLYDATFDDSKISAVEIIHHGIRTATNGDVRMNPDNGTSCQSSSSVYRIKNITGSTSCWNIPNTTSNTS